MQNRNKSQYALREQRENPTTSIMSPEDILLGYECIHQLVEAQVARTPEAPALVVKGETWSYARLNREANRLAHRLRLLGVGPEVMVGVCLPRTADLLITLLAILKANGAYVPLDPAYPPDRLHFQVEDSEASLLITNSSLETLWEGIAVTRLYLDQRGEEKQAESSAWEENLENHVQGKHLAYVMYTSGSTGRPKGVCIVHQNTLALINWSLRHFSLADIRGMVAGTSVCFDLSIFEIFFPWSCGGTIYLTENGLHLPEGEARNQITLLNMVPSVMAELARTTTIPDSVRVITFCGETLPRPLVEQLYQLPGIERIYNLYGPTEDTTYSTWSLLDRDEHGENVPIGYPLDGSQVYLLDPNGKQVPYGESGEIYLGGAGVTRGYWKRPDLTEQRFVPDTFSQQPGARLYRTGDLARYRADGQLEFLGRLDQQVKIRGHRIELGEIESVLRQHPEVKEGVVLARKSPPNSTYLILVAYVAPLKRYKELEDELQEFLKRRLPDYMIPTLFVFLDSLPKTSNGKLDRNALPDPQAGKERPHGQPAPSKRTSLLNASAGKKELLKKLLKKESIATPTSLVPEAGAEPLVVAGEDGEDVKERKLFPLSFMQQRYWLIDQLDPGTPLYNIFFAFRATGNFDVEAMTRSLHEVVRRHEPLRTKFLKVDGVPMQQVCPPSEFPIPLYDLRSLSEEEREQEEQRRLLHDPLISIDIRQGLLLYASFLQLADNVFDTLITIHHVACDGWSIDILRDELGALYEAFSHGRPSPLPDLPIRYVDYVLWQRRRLQGPLIEQQLSYWRHQLANLPAPLQLPTDRPRTGQQTFNGNSYRFTLPPELYRALMEIAQQEGVTLFMTIFAVYQTLLCRLSGQEDILVGTPIANRTQASFEKMIGCFVNTIVFRTDMQGNPSFRTLLQRVRSMALGAYGHQDVSFEQVLHIVRPERDSAYTYSPLFQVMFHFDNIAPKTDRDVEIDVENLAQRNMAAKFDLSVRVRVKNTDEGTALEGVFFYNTDLFDLTTIARFAQRLHYLMETAVAQPDQCIWQLPILPGEEEELLSSWNDTYQEMEAEEQVQSIQQLFEAQAARMPEAPALAVQGETLSYAQLNQRANQLAHYLRRYGVGPEMVVGLYLPCTPDLLVALLAVLKAGGAYLPLDPTSSAEQVIRLLQETQTTLVITGQELQSGEQSIQQICLANAWSSIEQEQSENLQPRVTRENAAYVLLSANAAEKSTAVVVEHRQLLNYTQALAQRIALQPGSTFALLQPLTSDLAVMAIYPTLCTGGTLHILPPEHMTAASNLSEYFREHAIEYLAITPAHLTVLHAAMPDEPLMPGKCLIIAGESSSWSWVRQLKEEHPTCMILNHYSSNETTVGATTYLVQPEKDERRYTSTPIGKPLANTQVSILNSSLEPVPINLPGEMYIGGANVACGSLHNAKHTIEKFVQNPFSKEPHARLYHTGDLARYLADGTIELLGRVADQVKVRGIWIDQGKVQAVLSRHPAVHFVKIVVREETGGEKRLVAYVLPQKGQRVTVADLRRYILQYFPIYMAPSAFVLLDTLPLTTDGHIDYQALPLPESFKEQTRTHAAPQSEIELKLVQIWENILQVKPIGIHDSFFDLGGNSLVAVRLMAKIQREFQQDLPIAVLFQKATPALLATELLQRRWSTTHAALVEIQPTGTRRPFFCVHPVGGEVICYAELARQLGPDQPFYGFQVPKRSQPQLDFQTIEEMACSYIVEMQEVQPDGPYLLGGWSLGGVIAFEMAQQLLRQGQQVAFLALIESVVPSPQQQNNKPLVELFSEDLEGVFSQKLYNETMQLQGLSTDEQLLQVYINARQENIIPPDLELKQLQVMFSIYRRNMEAMRHYQSQTYAGQITLFTTQRARGKQESATIRAWQELAPGRLTVHTIPGNHYSILKRPNLYHLADVLKESLNNVQ